MKQKVPKNIKQKLEQIRKSIKEENVSYGELLELETLSEFIDPNDVQLLEWAGVPEFPENQK